MIRFGVIFLIAYFLGAPAYATIPPDIEKDIKRFVQKSPNVNGLRVEVEFLEANLNMPTCTGGTVEISAAPGTRIWGKTTLQLRCAKAAWMINVPLNVHVFGDYVVASRYLPFGSKLDQADMRVIEGDLSLVPDDVLRSPKIAYERALSKSMQMGSPIGLNDLKESSVIKAGDPVRLILTGRDFEVSGEGVAQTPGIVGDMVRVRLADGQVLQGKVLRQSVVMINVE
jgi:flagella basal body P-ring formation protein FlgA